MPTKEQMEAMRERLMSLPTEGRDAAMDALDWEGFTEAEKLDVERRVMEGEDQEYIFDGIVSEPPEDHRGTKTYQVFHDPGWPESYLSEKLGGAPAPSFPEHFVHVANVQANGLKEAVELTTDKGGMLDDTQPWVPWERNGRAEPLVMAPRDTVPGDVIVDPNGNAYRFVRSQEYFEKEYFMPVEPSYEDIRRQAAEQARYRVNENQMELE